MAGSEGEQSGGDGDNHPRHPEYPGELAAPEVCGRLAHQDYEEPPPWPQGGADEPGMVYQKASRGLEMEACASAGPGLETAS